MTSASPASSAVPEPSGSPEPEDQQPEAQQPEDPAQLPDEGRITLLLTSPRSAPGLLTWTAWQRLSAADVVLVADLDPIWGDEFAAAGVVVEDVTDLPPGQRAGTLVDRASAPQEVVWWGSPDGDPGLTDALAEHLSRRAVAGEPPQIEVLTGSHDVQGARLIDLVATMDILRSPGGCPWDGEQTHTSLLPYLLEETHELIEAIESGSRDHLREELGDLLFQVVFHARVAQEDAAQPFDIDDVAAGLVEKLVRRHPHVFNRLDGETAPEMSDLEQNWERLKSAEKPQRAGFDGIPATLPALARAQKMLGRLERAGLEPETAAVQAAGLSQAAGLGPAAGPGQAAAPSRAEAELAAVLLGAVLQAREGGLDAEATLRAALARLPNP